MATEIEDNELQTELQELYLKTKQWISDLEFLNNDLEFLKSLYGRFFPKLTQEDDFETIANILIKAAKIQQNNLDLKNEIQKYLHKLEPVLIESKPHFNLNVIEGHSQLQLGVEKILEDYKAIKTLVFLLSKNNLNAVTPTHN